MPTSWHVLSVRPQRELAVQLRLVARWPRGQGSPPTPYVPMDGEQRRRPLFPGYVLAQFALEQAAYVTAVADVASILGLATDSEIEVVRAIERAGGTAAYAVESGELRIGMPVCARLWGVDVYGRILEHRGGRVRVLANVLSGATVWVDRRQVKAVA